MLVVVAAMTPEDDDGGVRGLAAMTPEDDDGGVRGLAAMTPEDKDGAVQGLATQIVVTLWIFPIANLYIV